MRNNLERGRERERDLLGQIFYFIENNRVAGHPIVSAKCERQSGYGHQASAGHVVFGCLVTCSSRSHANLVIVSKIID
jgi:hypothetical protein